MNNKKEKPEEEELDLDQFDPTGIPDSPWAFGLMAFSMGLAYIALFLLLVLIVIKL